MASSSFVPSKSQPWWRRTNAHSTDGNIELLSDEEDPELGRLSFKAINPKFLLKYDE